MFIYNTAGPHIVKLILLKNKLFLLLSSIFTESFALPIIRALEEDWVVIHERLIGNMSSSSFKDTLTDWVRLRVDILYVVLCDRTHLKNVLIQVGIGFFTRIIVKPLCHKWH